MAISKRKKTFRRTRGILATTTTRADKLLSREIVVHMPNLPVNMRRLIDEWMWLSGLVTSAPTPEQREAAVFDKYLPTLDELAYPGDAKMEKIRSYLIQMAKPRQTNPRFLYIITPNMESFITRDPAFPKDEMLNEHQ